MQHSKLIATKVEDQGKNIEGEKKSVYAKQAVRGKLLPALILGFYVFTTWNPPLNWQISFTWYILLAVAGFVYILQQKPLNFEKARGYWIPEGLIFVGAIFALFRSDVIDDSLFNTLAVGISMVTYLILLPTFATKLGRIFILMGLLAAAFTWVYYVQTQRMILITLASSTFSGEDNKNIISFCMALAATAMMAFSVLWNKPIQFGRLAEILVRLSSAGAGLYTIYTISLTYSRSQLMTSLIGLTISILLIALKLRSKKGIILSGLALIIVGALIYVVVPNVLTISVGWENNLDPLLEFDSTSSFALRKALLGKGYAMILDNPLIGIGAGNTKPIYFDGFEYHPRGLLHNSYLTVWAEFGILGVIAILYWLLLYIRLVRRSFFQLQLIDQIWLVVILPYLFGIFFINVAILIIFSVLSGMYYSSIENLDEVLAP